jgi:hypothetical protein
MSENGAATAIQAEFRGHEARSDFKAEREATIAVQAKYRGDKGRQDADDESKSQKAAEARKEWRKVITGKSADRSAFSF